MIITKYNPNAPQHHSTFLDVVTIVQQVSMFRCTLLAVKTDAGVNAINNKRNGQRR